MLKWEHYLQAILNAIDIHLGAFVLVGGLIVAVMGLEMMAMSITFTRLSDVIAKPSPGRFHPATVNGER
jgi:small neutral amino acid transporter SnatA (MarC family)